MVEKAYGKLNICLDCLGLRDDGYHNIKSVVLPIEFHDSLEITILPKKVPDDFVVCDDFSLKVSKYNLVHKMIDICRAKWGFQDHLNVNIHKNIYIQSGLGGGSADAAAALRAIIKLFNIKPKEEEIKEICLEVGSDVYFQYYNKSGIISSKGEEVEFFEHNFKPYIILARPILGNSTKQVFLEADNCELIHGNVDGVKDSIINNDINKLGKIIFNSLLIPASKTCPAISQIIQELKDLGFEAYGMTGSGSCCFGLTYNKKTANKALKYFYKEGVQSDLTKFL